MDLYLFNYSPGFAYYLQYIQSEFQRLTFRLFSLFIPYQKKEV